MKTALSFRLSDEARRLLKAVSENLGVSLTAALELAIREFAKKHGVK